MYTFKNGCLNIYLITRKQSLICLATIYNKTSEQIITRDFWEINQIIWTSFTNIQLFNTPDP